MWGWVGGKSREETPPPFPVTTNSMSGSRGVGREGVLRKDYFDVDKELCTNWKTMMEIVLDGQK